jgi:hypothetical protein
MVKVRRYIGGGPSGPTTRRRGRGRGGGFAPLTRNEGVRGSSPRVGSGGLPAFALCRRPGVGDLVDLDDAGDGGFAMSQQERDFINALACEQGMGRDCVTERLHRWHGAGGSLGGGVVSGTRTLADR